MFKNYEKTIFILIGIQASGKSTFCKQFFNEEIRINLDTLKTRKKETEEIKNLLTQNKNCVIDNTNTTIEFREKYIDYAKEYKYKIVGIYFRSSIDECLKRNEQRIGKEKLTEKAIISIAKTLEQPNYNEGFDELYYTKIENDKFIIDKWKEEL